MSSSPEPHAAHSPQEHHAHPNYIKVWVILVALLVVSVLGPMLEIRIITLTTAFGIAVVKAYLVAKNFMHLDVERRLVVYILVTCLALMVLFFFAVSPDVMKHMGANWENVGAKNMIKLVEEPHHGGEHAAPAHVEAPAAEPTHGDAAPAEPGAH